MTIKWRKLGNIFCASGQNELMQSGGRAPVPLLMYNNVFRIYFASYDVDGRGRIFWLDIDIEKPHKIININTIPVIDIGTIGFFDDNGVIPSDVILHANKVWLYTIGFSLKNKIIFDAASGLAISSDGGASFRKIDGPVLDRGVDDPCFAASPTVMIEDGIWRMWYVSCHRWKKEGNKFKHYYNIKHKYSKDGIYWDQKSTTCIDYQNEFEYAISRPSVIRSKNGLYRMWYSFRAQSNVDTYRIGYAESLDGLSWTRMDDMAGINVSEQGWDSEMICYPRVFQQGDRLYMLYNGNGYGKTGFGLAVMEGA